MRTRVTDYTITIDDGFVFVNIAIPAGKSPTSNATTKPMREAIRLIIDETAKVTFCSSMKKDNIADILPNNPSSGYCSVKFAIPEGKTITASDHFTIEMDWGNDLGAPGDSASANTVFGKIKEIYEYLAGQTPEEIPEGLGDRMNLLLQFFGLPQALPEYQSMPLLEMTDMLEYIMTTIDPDLTAEQAAAITEETLSSDSSDDSSD